MPHAASVVRYIAFGLLVVYAVFGAVFIVGETLLDPGGTTGVLLTVSWLVPMTALAGYTAARPRPAALVLTVVSALIAAFVVLETLFRFTAGSGLGPAGFVSVFAVAVPLGVLGLRQPARAGWLLLLVGVPLAASLGGGATAVAAPVLLIGALYLLAGRLGSRPEPAQPSDSSSVRPG